MIELAPSYILDKVYAVQRLGASLKELDKEVQNIRTSSSDGSALDESENLPATMLLSPSDGKLIASCLEVPEMEQEIERAIHQVHGELKAEKELEREKHALAANKGPEAKEK